MCSAATWFIDPDVSHEKRTAQAVGDIRQEIATRKNEAMWIVSISCRSVLNVNIATFESQYGRGLIEELRSIAWKKD